VGSGKTVAYLRAQFTLLFAKKYNKKIAKNRKNVYCAHSEIGQEHIHSGTGAAANPHTYPYPHPNMAYMCEYTMYGTE